MFVGYTSGAHLLFSFLKQFVFASFLILTVVGFAYDATAQAPSNLSGNRRASVPDEALWSYRKLLGAGDYARAAAAIEQIRRSGKVPADEQWRLTLDLTKTLRFDGKLKAAGKVIEQLSGSDALRPSVRIEKAWLQVLDGQGVGAIAMLETLRIDSDVEVRCHAGYLLGKVLFEQERIQPCLDACDKTIRDFRKVDFYHNPYDWELLILRSELQKLRAKARDYNITHLFGDDYANYRRGRLAQIRGQYHDAISYFRLVKAPILTDAANCYIGACLRDSGMVKEAAAHWQAFIQKDELGLYRGEAIYQLGEMYLLHSTDRSQLALAEQWLKRAVEWHDKVAGTTPPVTVDSIQAILKAFPLPPELATRDRFGNFHRGSAEPETIVNRLTSTWYLKDLHLQSMTLHAFSLFELGKPGAKNAFVNILTLAHANPGLLALGDTPQRLMIDAQDGAFVIPRAVWTALPAETAMRLHLACFYLRVGKLEDAKSLFGQVYRITNGNTERILAWSVCQLGMAYVAFGQSRPNEAIDGLAKFETTLSASPLAPMGWLWAANIYAGQKEGLAEAQQRYAQVVKAMPNSDIAARALLSLALASENAGDRKNALSAASMLVKNSFDSRYQAAAITLISRMQGVQIRSARTGKDDERPGRVIPFDRHLVIPGHADFSLDISQYAMNDLVNYEIAYTIRSGCHFKSFYYRCSIDEPQVPPVDKSPFRFLRAPLFFMSN